MGTISCSNVNHPTAECTTLTYSIKDIGKLENAPKYAKKLDEASGEEGSIEIILHDYGTDNEQTDMKWKIKDCAKENQLHSIKKKLDVVVKTLGGQTTLDQA